MLSVCQNVCWKFRLLNEIHLTPPWRSKWLRIFPSNIFLIAEICMSSHAHMLQSCNTNHVLHKLNVSIFPFSDICPTQGQKSYTLVPNGGIP